VTAETISKIVAAGARTSTHIRICRQLVHAFSLFIRHYCMHGMQAIALLLIEMHLLNPFPRSPNKCCAGKCAGSTPCSVEEAIAHRALGVRFMYTQPLALAAGGLTDYIKKVDPGHQSVQ
jgi:hypothetical protein